MFYAITFLLTSRSADQLFVSQAHWKNSVPTKGKDNHSERFEDWPPGA